MANSSDKSTLISVPSRSIGSSSSSITNFESQFISKAELKRNPTNNVDNEADGEQANPNQLYEETAKLVEEYVSPPNPSTLSTSMSIIEYIQRYGGLENGNCLDDVQVTLAGRITSKRHASTTLNYYDLLCENAKVQIVADTKTFEMGKSEFSNLHSSVNVDDFVTVTGFPGKSKGGELCIYPKSFTVMPRDVKETSTAKTDFFLNDNANTRVETENHRTTSPSTSVRMVVVGDVHDDWELQSDFTALEFLQPDLVLFTGDFGNENVELVRSVAAVNMPKAVILGNHDSWTTSKFSKKIKDGVQLQLECLGEQHVGYSNLDFPALKLSVVGGRPFSLGGNKLFRPKLLTARYGIRTMEESAEKIHKTAIATPKGHSIVFLAHNGPTGLGTNKDDICGKDWVPEAGDNGDPDLAKAISLTKDSTHNLIPLVVFGHMHKQTRDAGLRKMMVTADSTMYLNAAIVPRVTRLSSDCTVRAFTVVEFSSGQITKVAETWVSVNGDSASLEEEHILFNSHSKQT